MEGWAKLHRKLMKWEWYHDSNMVHLLLHIILSANYEDKSWKGIEIQRGQLVTGLKSLHRDTGISIQSLRTCLSRLDQTGEINKQTNNQFTLITVNNYESYQLGSEESTSKLTNDQQTINKRVTPTKNTKKEKNINKFSKPTLIEVKKYCEERGNDVNPVKWFNHYQSNGWKVGKNPMKDWKAAIHTWENSEIGGVQKQVAYKREKDKINFSPIPPGDPMPDSLKEKFGIK